MKEANTPDNSVPDDTQVRQLEVNTRWLIARLDKIHAALCPDKNGTWQERVQQAMEAAKKLQAELDSERVLYKSLSEMHMAAKKDWWVERERLRTENQRLLSVLKKVEWSGMSDYSIGVSTCPFCGRRGGHISKKSKWYQGHSPDCEIGRILKRDIEERQCLSDPDSVIEKE